MSFFEQPAEALLRNLVETAKEQLAAAKEMDTERLVQATAFRKDLLFELELERGYVEETETLTTLKRELEELDQRLMGVLEVISVVCGVVLPDQKPEVYTSSGSLTKSGV